MTPATPEAGAEIQEIARGWSESPHADFAAEAFRHWDEEGEVPANCALCHVGTAMLDHIGADGSVVGQIDTLPRRGAPILCVSCHHPGLSDLGALEFPSGAEAAGFGTSTACALCHQGRSSTDSVEAAVAGLPEDSVNAELSFINVHYRAAAATLLGDDVRGGYQYPGKTYAGRFRHVEGFDGCTGCHDPHSLQVADGACLACHTDAGNLEGIRVAARDADGNGDATEGVAREIDALRRRLGDAIRAYASEPGGGPIAYASDSYPYFFVDTDADGVASPDEATPQNRYSAWTPRLLRAAYNFQFVTKDPGAYAHNPDYVLQLLIDSLESLGTAADTPDPTSERP